MANFKTTITKSNKELSAKERIQLKDTADAVSLNEVTKEGAFVLTPVVWAKLHVSLETDATTKEYDQIVIVGDDGQKYCTGSDSFIRAFIDICEEMEDETEEEWAVKVFRLPSKNFSGDFITCTII